MDILAIIRAVLVALGRAVGIKPGPDVAPVGLPPKPPDPLPPASNDN